jgi:predicted enzyme related to lactoylglutathione lyase
VGDDKINCISQQIQLLTFVLIRTKKSLLTLFKMYRKILLFLALLISFGGGFAFKSMLSNPFDQPAKVKKVTGVGGIFFKCKNPAEMRKWYSDHLGLNINPYGAVFEWYQGADSTRKGFLQWSPFAENTSYFEPSTKDFMINYRVENIEALVTQLKNEGVTICDQVESYEYGKFVHILDIEGNKLELWEPNDIEFEKMGKQMNLLTTK